MQECGGAVEANANEHAWWGGQREPDRCTGRLATGKRKFRLETNAIRKHHEDAPCPDGSSRDATLADTPK
jgi:hypothetical protein